MSISNILQLQVAPGIPSGSPLILVGPDGTTVRVTAEGYLETVSTVIEGLLEHETYGLSALYNILTAGVISIDLDAIIEDIGNPSARTNLNSIEDIIGWGDFTNVQSIGSILGAQTGDRYATSGDIGTDFATLLNSRLTSARATNLDELGAANIPTDIDTLLGRITAVRAGYLDELDFDLNARLGSPAGASLSADLVTIDTVVDTLASRLTTARAGYLDELDFDLNARLGSPAGASLAADLVAIDTVVDTVNSVVGHATYGNSAINTRIAGSKVSSTFSYLVAGGEQTALEITDSTIYTVRGLALDLSAFTSGRIITARSYYKVDGINYQKLDTRTYTIGTHDVIYFDDMVGLCNDFKVTLQINTVEAGNISVPYSYSTQGLT